MLKIVALNVINYIYLLLVLNQVNSGYMSDWFGMILFLMFSIGVLILSWLEYKKVNKEYALFSLILGYVNIIGFSIVFIITYLIK